MVNQVPPPPPPPDFGEPIMQGDPSEVRNSLMVPGIGLAVSAGLGILLIFVGLLMGGYDTGQQAEQILEMYREMGVEVDEEMMRQWMNISSALSWPMMFLQLACQSLMIAAGVSMIRLRSWNIAVAGSIIALIPCLTNCYCCILNIPLGIWALIVLNKAHVKNVFI